MGHLAQYLSQNYTGIAVMTYCNQKRIGNPGSVWPVLALLKSPASTFMDGTEDGSAK